ncbi:hypothetical protein BDW22DRAFT_1322182 [Trametopsis cervina]|nr:hypothetical protein BDW22DRAFT_1322182 [Trametopsis cervina]
MRVAAAVLALATSVCALTVTFPDNSTGWSDNGSNVVKWTRVSSDATNFTVVLVNQQVFPPYSQVLNALVDAGSDGGSVTVNPPSSGWPAKGQAGYQVNLATSAERTDALLAQSQPFGFHDPTSSSSASGSSVSVVSPSTFVASNTAS